MRHAIAPIVAGVLICLPTQLSAGERCTAPHAHRTEIARAMSAKPTVHRAAIARPQKIRLPAAWQRLLLVEQQIL